MTTVDWDEAFANAAYIKDGNTYPDRWRQSATAFVADQKKVDLDVSYGPHSRQKFDLFWPSTEPEGQVVFVHGGYWLDFDKSYWSHLAAGACKRDWAVAIPSYVLAPEAKISEITQMIGIAIEKCAELVDGPIVLVGHSAGGHLVTRMVCDPSPLRDGISARVSRVVSISGLHDLRNLIHTQMNEQLQLDLEEAIAESVALQTPITTTELICWVGAQERPEFLSQALVLQAAWKNRVADIQVVVEPRRHHFDVIESLTDPMSPLTLALIGAM